MSAVGFKRLLCSPSSLASRLSVVILRGICHHLKSVLVDDVRQLPAFLYLDEKAVVSERLRQLPHPLYTLVGARFEPKNRAAGDHPTRRGQVLVEPDENLAEVVALVGRQFAGINEVVRRHEEALRLMRDIIYLCDNEAEEHGRT